MNFPTYIHTLKSAFDSAGYELYAVGGCVRDRLLDRPVNEYDLTTNAHPDQMKPLLEKVGAHSLYLLGEKFGTIGLIFNGRPVEITTYRGEWYEPDSRKPTVRFGDSLEDDLARRDFTINAVAEEIGADRLIDPFGGSADLHRRLVRAVGVPDDRFRDDPLRLLRAARFASTLGFEIEPATFEAIRRCASRLDGISRERVRDETTKMLVGPAPARATTLLVELGLMEYIVPELLELRTVSSSGGGPQHKDVFAHTLRVVSGVPPGLVVRWAALLHDVGKPSTLGYKDGDLHFNGHEKVSEAISRRTLKRLHYDRPTVSAVSKVVGMHTHANAYHDAWTDGAVRRFVRDAGDELQALLELSRADVTSYYTRKVKAAARRIDELEARIQQLDAEAAIASLRPPLDGDDLMSLFDRPPGPWIRPIKDYLLDLVIEGELSPDDTAHGERLAREKYEQLFPAKE